MVTHNMLRMHEGKWVVSDKYIRFVTALDVIKSPTCALLNELPSNLTTMRRSELQVNI